MSTRHWAVGTPVVRLEVLHGHTWCAFSTRVVHDTDDLLAVFLSPGSRLAFPAWPFDRWEHPWLTAGHTAWHGHGKLMLQRPGDAYSVDLFWHGPGVKDDPLWLGRPDRNFVGVPVEVDGTYLPVVDDFNGDGRADPADDFAG